MANTIAFLQEPGIQPQEATEAEYQAAHSALARKTIEVPTTAAPVDGDYPSKHEAGVSAVYSTSLADLRSLYCGRPVRRKNPS